MESRPAADGSPDARGEPESAGLTRALERLIAELYNLLDARENSDELEPEDLVIPPIRNLREAVIAAEKHYPSNKLPHGPWIEWKGMSHCDRQGKEKNLDNGQREELYERFFRHRDALNKWAEAQLKKTAPIYLDTLELAALAGVSPKSFSNAHAEARKAADESKRPTPPDIPRKGNQPASFDYVAIRPWLLLKWPGRREIFAESPTEAKSDAQRRLRDG